MSYSLVTKMIVNKVSQEDKRNERQYKNVLPKQQIFSCRNFLFSGRYCFQKVLLKG